MPNNIRYANIIYNISPQRNLLIPNFFSEKRNIAYLMFGRNQGEPIEEHYYTPYPGVSNKKTHGFMEMINDEVCVFLEKLNGLYLEH